MIEETEQYAVLVVDPEEGSSRASVFTDQDAAVAFARSKFRSLERQYGPGVEPEESLPARFGPDDVLVYLADVDNTTITVTRVVPDQPHWKPQPTRRANEDRVRKLTDALIKQVHALEGLEGHPTRIPVWQRSAFDARQAVEVAGMTAYALQRAMQSSTAPSSPTLDAIEQTFAAGATNWLPISVILTELSTRGFEVSESDLIYVLGDFPNRRRWQGRVVRGYDRPDVKAAQS